MTEFIQHSINYGADIDITTLQNLSNNDQYLYDEFMRRPRGVIAYAEIGGIDSATVAGNFHEWTIIPDNAGGTLSVDADIEPNRLIKVELYIPSLRTNGPPQPNDTPRFWFTWAGIRLIRDNDGAVLSVPQGHHYWGSSNPDRRAFYTVAYDTPVPGRHNYAAQWKNNNINENDASIGVYHYLGGALGLSKQALYAEDTIGSGAVISKSQLIISDMGTIEGLDIESPIGDNRTRDKITSVDTSNIVRNVRRAPRRKSPHGL